MTAPRQAIVVPDAIFVSIQVLVVEDSAPIRDLLASHFLKHGMVVTTAADGTAAIQLLERYRGKFDLVVTDLVMPGADGFAVLMEAKRSNPGCSVVICTGYASLDSAIQAVRVGAYDYLPKPFKASEIRALLDRMAADRAWRGYRPVSPAGQPAPDPSVAIGPVLAHAGDDLADRLQRLETRVAALESDGIPTRV